MIDRNSIWSVPPACDLKDRSPSEETSLATCSTEGRSLPREGKGQFNLGNPVTYKHLLFQPSALPPVGEN